ncbi:hypothetical protein RUA4292_03057 [Ruegeria atlantica]|uniref:Uncharacterized protein n=1 Tax=Ruegeria atlantica TaxID=81569 RepID=A0A0P1F4F9_9RHOB|nr:hypothetical protein RUA4292_03057 [Ruegeria atlantica]
MPRNSRLDRFFVERLLAFTADRNVFKNPQQ